MLEITMNQLLKRRGEAEHAIKDLESLYAQTVVKSMLNAPFFLIELDSQNPLLGNASVSQKSAAHFRERVSDKYNRIRVVLDGDERLMMQIIDAEETYMTEWLKAQRGMMEAQIKEIESLRESSKSLLQETNDLRFLQVG